MREVIASLDTRLITIPLARTWGPTVREMHVIAVTVRSSEGAMGCGFSWTPSIGAASVRAMLDVDIRSHVLGGSIDPTVVWDDLWLHLHEAGSGGVTTIAMAGLDLALHDLASRARGLPLVDHLGRVRDWVPVYASGVNLHYSIDELAGQAQRAVDAGFRGVKVKVGKRDLAEDIDRIAAVREVIGPGRLLMIDANQRWDLRRAVAAVGALSQFGLHWVEEPLRADDLPGHVALRADVGVRLAAGENIHTSSRFREFLDRGALDVVQPNVIRVGGITPFLRITGEVVASGATLAPHLLPELSGQLALTLDVETTVEDVEDARFDRLGALAAPSGVSIRSGRLTAQTGPGLGLMFR